MTSGKYWLQFRSVFWPHPGLEPFPHQQLCPSVPLLKLHKQYSLTLEIPTELKNILFLLCFVFKKFHMNIITIPIGLHVGTWCHTQIYSLRFLPPLKAFATWGIFDLVLFRFCGNDDLWSSGSFLCWCWRISLNLCKASYYIKGWFNVIIIVFIAKVTLAHLPELLSSLIFPVLFLEVFNWVVYKTFWGNEHFSTLHVMVWTLVIG